MVIVKLIGGLGNQLFQYAAGRRLAASHGVELKMDVSWLGNPAYRTVRHYELAPFNIPQEFSTPSDLEQLIPRYPTKSRLLKLITGRDTGLSEAHIREPHYHFDPRVLELPDGVYLDGYWQSEKYFVDVAETIRKEVTVTAPLAGRNSELAQEILGCEAVSLHVRRGDYVHDPLTNQVHGICGLDYYDRALAHIASKVSHPVFFVFSDDHSWVQEYLKLDYPAHYVDHNDTAHGHEDMRLMSLCHHHIIANSSFSWWGAWLNPRPDKIVVAPQRWFNEHNADTRDLCPMGWTRL